MQKYSQEELEEMQDQIPEWKWTAMTVVTESPEEKKGIVKKAIHKVGEKIKATSFMQKLSESEDYKKYKKQYHEFVEEIKEVKEKVSEDVHQSENRAVSTFWNLSGIIFSESAASQATKIMQKYDPSFDLYDFHLEAKEIFIEFFNNLLEGDLEYL